MVDLTKLGAHFAMSSLFSEYPENARIYCYDVQTKDYRLQRSGKMRLATGQARFTSEITQESEMLMFGVLHFGDHNLHGGVSKWSSDEKYRSLSQSAGDAFSRSDLAETIRRIDDGFERTYSIRNLFRDEQRRVMHQVLQATLEDMEAFYRQTYENQTPLLRFLYECHIPIPTEMRMNAQVALNDLLGHALETDELDVAQIESLFDQVPVSGASLDSAALEIILRRNLERTCRSFFDQPRDLELLHKCRGKVQAATSFPLPLRLWSMQNHAYAVLQNLYPEMKQSNQSDWVAEFEALVKLLGLHL